MHFDQPVGSKKAASVATSPKTVATHSFYPLIKYSVTSQKISKSSSGIIVSKKTRPIAYAAHMDSHIYSYYAQQLSALYETKLKEYAIEDCVLAFRSLGTSNIEFAAMAFEEIRTRQSCCAVALDVSGFFDNLDHNIVKETWSLVLNKPRLPEDHHAIYKSLTKFSAVNKEKLYAEFSISSNGSKDGLRRVCNASEFRNIVRAKGLIERNKQSFGIPQGTPISALISNIYMLDFDVAAKKIVGGMGGRYFRYCDDMLFIVPTEFKDSIAGIMRMEIRKIKLDLNTKKTEIRVFKRKKGVLQSDKPLQYLGFLFDGQRVLIRSASLARFSQRMKRGVKLAKSTMKKRNKIRVQNGQSEKTLFKRKIYMRYSHLGHRNFIRYGFRAADILKSKEIKEQLKPLWQRLVNEVET